MVRERILIVEDDADILELLRYNLEREGYTLTLVSSGEEAVEFVGADSTDLILLDLMLPGLDGLDVCKILKSKAETSGIPVIMLTAKSEESDIVIGLELGADDYIVKPFSPRVLLARVKAVIRARESSLSIHESEIQFSEMLIRVDQREVLVSGESVSLSATEFRILRLLASHPGRVFTRDSIIDHVHGEGYAATDRSIDVQIVSLRKKLGVSSVHIETIRGVGYRFKE